VAGLLAARSASFRSRSGVARIGSPSAGAARDPPALRGRRAAPGPVVGPRHCRAARSPSATRRHPGQTRPPSPRGNPRRGGGPERRSGGRRATPAEVEVPLAPGGPSVRSAGMPPNIPGGADGRTRPAGFRASRAALPPARFPARRAAARSRAAAAHPEGVRRQDSCTPTHG
jgi:hypothetical protein